MTPEPKGPTYTGPGNPGPTPRHVETKGREPLACASTGGRWSPNEDRPVHATLDGERSVCGVDGIEVIKDPEPVPFHAIKTHRCKRCADSPRAHPLHEPHERESDPETKGQPEPVASMLVNSPGAPDLYPGEDAAKRMAEMWRTAGYPDAEDPSPAASWRWSATVSRSATESGSGTETTGCSFSPTPQHGRRARRTSSKPCAGKRRWRNPMADPIQVGELVETPEGPARLVEWLASNTLVVRLEKRDGYRVRHFARADCRVGRGLSHA